MQNKEPLNSIHIQNILALNARWRAPSKMIYSSRFACIDHQRLITLFYLNYLLEVVRVICCFQWEISDDRGLFFFNILIKKKRSK